jgi:hypothetical protein
LIIIVLLNPRISTQAKLEKSHKELRAVLDENKALKEQLQAGERTRGKIKDINGYPKMVNGSDGSPGSSRKVG